MTQRALPEPGSPQLEVLPREAHRLLYCYLYERWTDPPTMAEIRAHLAETVGDDRSQTDRRVRELRSHFDVQVVRSGREYRYQLTGWSATPQAGARKPINRRLRAEVLAPQRCAQCGRRPLDHRVVLEVDHKLPREWGGTDDIDNLQPLCEDCNGGKKSFYASYDGYAEEITAAAAHPEPHGRIGELLKAFRGQWVPSSLLGLVASMQQYQEDWQKRLRELRKLGWTIESDKRKDPITRRVSTAYRVVTWRPWPEGSIRAEITRRERADRQKLTWD